MDGEEVEGQMSPIGEERGTVRIVGGGGERVRVCWKGMEGMMRDWRSRGIVGEAKE